MGLNFAKRTFMHFIENYTFLKSIFNPALELNEIPGSKTEIRFCVFESPAEINPETEVLQELRRKLKGGDNDQMILENHKFYYPVFCPSGKKKNDKAILMLHGLNERKWDKYLVWAYYLAEQTGKSVILFPTSFHLNRGPSQWLDVRQLTKMVEERMLRFNNSQETSFANLTLSERLTESPERFFLSGLQTANDIASLLKVIQRGEHPSFEINTKADVFAYSIGGLLAQVLMMENPGGLLTDSKLFLFCAGSVFEHMNGVSRCILDSTANEKIHNYYENEFENELKRKGIVRDFFNESRLGMAFRSMIALNRYRKSRESVFHEISDQTYAVTLKDDKVIPADKICENLLGAAHNDKTRVEILHFDYPYLHEMPFPTKLAGIEDKVNEAFRVIFGKAAAFLA
jgi:pimeloyl-ACP methyl ester carboxylesterase